MRLRNIKRARKVIDESAIVIKTKKDLEDFLKKKPCLQIEIGMGKGSFIIDNALTYKDIHFIGIEKYASVTLRAVEKMADLRKEEIDVPNLRFLSQDAGLLKDFFEESSIDGIFLNFSDPWPKNRQAHRRLTSDFYLDLYKTLLKPKGFIEQKTDNRPLFDYSVQQYLRNGFQVDYLSYDLYSDESLLKQNIATEYERKFHSLGNKIFKVRVIRPSMI